MMRDVIGTFLGVTVTPWKLVGFVGALMVAVSSVLPSSMKIIS